MAFSNASKAVVLGLTVTVTGAFVGVQSAQAASLFDFSYDTGVGKTLSGRISGTRSGDDVTILSVLNTFVDGVETDPINNSEIFSFDARTRLAVGAAPGAFSLPTISFSGNLMDVVACVISCVNPNDGSVAQGFVFSTTDVLATLFGTSANAGQPGSGETTNDPNVNGAAFSSAFNGFSQDFNSPSQNTYLEAFDANNWTLTQIPEPSALLGLATIGLLGFATRKRKK